jgi:protocatechuate 3,4-dioxygenase beta subunit
LTELYIIAVSEKFVPGRYHIPPGLTGFDKLAGVLRPAHFHLKTSSTEAVPLITQIYFAGGDAIPNDPWALKSMNIINFDKSKDGWRSTFDVVLVRYA